jgi:hypothetical protein
MQSFRCSPSACQSEIAKAATLSTADVLAKLSWLKVNCALPKPSAHNQQELMLETYPIDIAPEQIVRWLMVEGRLRAFDLLVSATRSFEPGALIGGASRRLGEEEREEVSEVSEVGLLEVMPRQRPHIWTLRVRVEDDIGPRLPEDEPVPETEEELDLPTFYEEFIKADRGLTEVSVEVDSPAAKASFNRVLDAILTDRHQRGKSKPAPVKPHAKKC